MAHKETISLGFFSDAVIVALSPLARLLYLGIRLEADEYGRLKWKPNTFKLRYLPGDACDIHALCRELTNAGLVNQDGHGNACVSDYWKCIALEQTCAQAQPCCDEVT